jgi:hypothetical protein
VQASPPGEVERLNGYEAARGLDGGAGVVKVVDSDDDEGRARTLVGVRLEAERDGRGADVHVVRSVRGRRPAEDLLEEGAAARGSR